MRKYEEYRDSGLEWIGEIPKHWEFKRLKYIINCKLKYGANESGVNYDQSLPRYIRISDFGNNGKLINCKKLSLKYNIAKDFLLKDGDILFARSGATVGKAYQFKSSLSTEENYCYAGYLIKAEPDTRQILSDLLYAFTQSGAFMFWKDSVFNKSTIENIGADKYSELCVPIPPLQEQKAIADFLDDKCAKVDALVSVKEQQIALLKERRQAVIHQAVTKGLDSNVERKDSGIDWIGDIPKHWEVRRLATLGIFSKGGGFSKADLVEESGTAAILYGDIYTKYNYKVNESVRLISNHVASEAVEIYFDDLLFTGSGETKEDIGKCVVLKTKTKTIAGGDVIIFRQTNNNSSYLSFYLNTNGIKYEKARTSKGEIIVHTYASKLRELFLTIPPIAEQEAIVTYLEAQTSKIDQAIVQKQEQILKLKEYKQSLINEVVTGKLKVS